MLKIWMVLSSSQLLFRTFITLNFFLKVLTDDWRMSVMIRSLNTPCSHAMQYHLGAVCVTFAGIWCRGRNSKISRFLTMTLSFEPKVYRTAQVSFTPWSWGSSLRKWLRAAISDVGILTFPNESSLFEPVYAAQSARKVKRENLC